MFTSVSVRPAPAPKAVANKPTASTSRIRGTTLTIDANARIVPRIVTSIDSFCLVCMIPSGRLVAGGLEERLDNGYYVA
jgi:hypothetical protein